MAMNTTTTKTEKNESTIGAAVETAVDSKSDNSKSSTQIFAPKKSKPNVLQNSSWMSITGK